MFNCSTTALRSDSKPSTKLLFGCLLSTALLWSSQGNATVFLQNNFESSTCGAAISDQNADNVFWDTIPELPTNVRCTLATPNGSKYVEWNWPSSLNVTAAELYNRGNTNLNVSVTAGTTYYLATFVRFQRVGGADIWADTGSTPYQFDKLIEFRGTGFRWGIGSGWNGWYATGTDHKFAFDAWYATSVLGEHGPDHLVANVSPYSSTSPLLCDYETWYGVVLGVTAAASDSGGRVQLWVNGVKTIDKAQYTAASGATVNMAIVNGTVAQPAYNAPNHTRQMDNIIITDNWQDIVNGGYLSTSANGVLPPRTLYQF